MIDLGISVGILGIIVIVLGYCMYRKRNQIKAKSSDEQLCIAEYNPTAESVRILEGVDPLEELQRRVLISRLQSGIERDVEDLGFIEENRDEFSFEQTLLKERSFQKRNGQDSEVTVLD